MSFWSLTAGRGMPSSFCSAAETGQSGWPGSWCDALSRLWPPSGATLAPFLWLPVGGAPLPPSKRPLVTVLFPTHLPQEPSSGWSVAPPQVSPGRSLHFLPCLWNSSCAE